MSDKDKKGYVKEGRSFETERVEFLKEIYERSRVRNDDLRPINLENRQFYEGKDKLLEERALNPNVKRSAIFVPELPQAVDARIGNAVSRLEQADPTLVGRPRIKKPTPQQKDQCADIGADIEQQMRDCGYLPDVFEEHARGAEIHRTPSVLKVFWKHDQREVPVVREMRPGGLLDALRSMMMGPQEEVAWESRDVGGPSVQWLYPEDVLYEENVSTVDDMRYMGHRMWLESDELIALAQDQGYDMKLVNKYREECESGKGEDGSSDSMRDEEQDDKETPWDVGYRDGKYLLIEWYVKSFDEAGNKRMHLCVMLGNRYLIKDTDPEHKGFDFPFVFLVMNRLPGTVEGLSSIDRGKGLQRAYNEEYNSHFDLLSYGLFTPFKTRQGNQIHGNAVWEPGAIWYMDDPDEFNPAMTPPMRIPELGPSIEALGAKIRNVIGGAEDIDQGFQQNPYEKATSTKMRALGSAKRELPTMKKYGRTVIRVAEMFLALNQTFHAEKTRFVVEGGIWFDVPSLTADTDPEMEKQELLLALSTVMAIPMYQNPIGMQKVANILEEYFRKMKRSDWADFAFTPEEIQMITQQVIAQQQAMIEKQDAQERLQMLSATTPEAQQQGAK